jgi:type II restriction endonuclease EcoO109I-like protein
MALQQGEVYVNRKTRKLIEQYVSENIESFHNNRIEGIDRLTLDQVLLNKNPYLFKAKNLNLAADLVAAVLDARLSSSEEGSFGGFLESLAVYVSKITVGGRKSAAEGIDIELERKGIRYLIAVKSGKNWGNASQHKQLKANFRTAVKVLRQSKHAGQLQPTLGICYGNFKTRDNGEYLHIGGQSFWHLISGDRNLYIDLIEPIGYRAERHDEMFKKQKDGMYNRMIREFTIAYCDANGTIEWPKLVRFVSGNMQS